MESAFPIILVIAILAIGIVLCFAGLKYLRKIVAVYLLVGGFLFCYNFLMKLPDTQYALVISIIVGAVLSLLSAFFIKFCIFMTGGVAGILLYYTLSRTMPYLFGSSENVFLYCVLFFAVLGALALIVKKHLIIIFTSFIGAQGIAQAAGMLMGVIINPSVAGGLSFENVAPIFRESSMFISASGFMLIIPSLIFFVAGLIAQYKITGKGAKL